MCLKGSVFVELATEEEVQAVLEAKLTLEGNPLTVLTKYVRTHVIVISDLQSFAGKSSSRRNANQENNATKNESERQMKSRKAKQERRKKQRQKKNRRRKPA